MVAHQSQQQQLRRPPPSSSTSSLPVSSHLNPPTTPTPPAAAAAAHDEHDDIVNLISSDEEEGDIADENSHHNHNQSPALPSCPAAVAAAGRTHGRTGVKREATQTTPPQDKTNGKGERLEKEGDEDDDDDELQVVSCVRAAGGRTNHHHHHSNTDGSTNTGGQRLSFSSQQKQTNSPSGSNNSGSTTTNKPGHGPVHHRTQNGNTTTTTATTTTTTTSTRRNTNNILSSSSSAHHNQTTLEVVDSRQGIQPLVNYSHFRFQCATKPFKRQRVDRKKLFCSKCFCYVCDIPVDKCVQWTDHCKASDTVAMWRNQRKARQDKRRKLAVNPAKRGTILSRVAMPVAVDVSDDEAVVFVGGHRNNNGGGGGGNNEGEKENQNQNDGVQTNNNNDNDNDKEDDKDDDDDIEASMDLFESTQWYKGNIINNTNTNDVTTTDDGKNKALAGSSKDSSLRETHVNGGPEPYDDGLVSVLSEGSSLTMDDLADALDTAASKRRPLLLDQYSSKFFGTSAK